VELKAKNPLGAIALGQLTSLLIDSLTHYEQEQVRNDWVFSSFYHAALLPLLPYPKALLYEALPDNWILRADALQADAIHLHWSGASAQAIRRIHTSKRKVRVYTVNDPVEAHRLERLGVEGVFTDRIRDVNKLRMKP
jgi:glycerophosphoryl diester phosphodiesterase